MGVCKYCGTKIIRLSATKCKKCFDEVFRYTESVKWFEFTEMDKGKYFIEILKMAQSPTIKKHFYLESDGKINNGILDLDEMPLLVLRGISYFKDVLYKDGTVNKVKNDNGCLIVTNRKITFVGRIVKIKKEFVDIVDIEDHDGIGIKIQSNLNKGNQSIRMYQYFTHCVDEKYLIRKLWEYHNAGITKECMDELGLEVGGKRYRVSRPAPIPIKKAGIEYIKEVV